MHTEKPNVFGAADLLRELQPLIAQPPSRDANFACLLALTLSSIAVADLIALWHDYDCGGPVQLFTAAIGIAILVYRTRLDPPPVGAVIGCAVLLALAMARSSQTAGDLSASGLSLVMYDSLVYGPFGNTMTIAACFTLQSIGALWFDTSMETSVYFAWECAAMSYLAMTDMWKPSAFQKTVLWCLCVAVQVGYTSASMTAPLHVSFSTSMLIYFY